MSGFVRYTVATLMIFWPLLLVIPAMARWVMRGERRSKPTHRSGT